MTVWLDVTTILGWQRPAVGIVRAEAECAHYALLRTDGVIDFCRYDAERRYTRVARQDVQRALERILGVPRPADSGAGDPVAEASREAEEPKRVDLIEHFYRVILNRDPDEEGLRFWKETLTARLAEGTDARDAYASAAETFFLNAEFAARNLSDEQFICTQYLTFYDRWPDAQEFAYWYGQLVSGMQRGVVLNAFMYSEQFRQLVTENAPAADAVDAPAATAAMPCRESEAANFDRGDVYLSLGLDWDQKDLVYLFGKKRREGFKVVLFCYDVIPVKLPQLCVHDVAAAFARYFANLAWCADEVLCISECSRKDLQVLLVRLAAPTPTMSVVRLGCQLPGTGSRPASLDVIELLGKRFILFVSTIERRKNHETLYRAYTRLVEQGVEDLPLLVFVGMRGWGINDLVKDLELDPRTRGLIKVLNNVEDADLARLYQYSLFTVFPSLYEGWGLPVGEALAAGKFCLASNAASIPEVGGDLIEYVDPWDVSAWAEKLHWYMTHPAELRERERRIRREYRPCDWSDTAQFVIDKALALA